MKQYRLTVDGQPSWSSFFIEAADDAAAARRAAAIAASHGRAGFTLTRGGRALAFAGRVAETLQGACAGGGLRTA